MLQEPLLAVYIVAAQGNPRALISLLKDLGVAISQRRAFLQLGESDKNN